MSTDPWFGRREYRAQLLRDGQTVGYGPTRYSYEDARDDATRHMYDGSGRLHDYHINCRQVPGGR